MLSRAILFIEHLSKKERKKAVVKKEEYRTPLLEVTLLRAEDVICTSGITEAPPDSGDIDQGSWL